MSASAAIIAEGAPIASQHRRDDEPILVRALLKPGFGRGAVALFGDDRWDMSPAVFRENAHHGDQRIDFSLIVCPWVRLTAKEYLWARLNLPPKPGVRKTSLAPVAARATLRMLLRFAHFIEERNGRFSMAAVDQPLLDAYLAHVRGNSRAAHRARLIEVVIDLNRHSEHLTLGGFSCRPWLGRIAHQVAGSPKRSVENSTPRIPEPVIAALLKWAFKYVDLFSADIFAGRAELNALRRQRKPWVPFQSMRHLVIDYVGRRCLEGRGIPITTAAPTRERYIDPATGAPEPPINFPVIALHLACTKTQILHPDCHARPILLNALKRLGPEIGGMDTPIAVDPDTGRPWRERFEPVSIAHEEKMLQAACFIICAYLTGMRDSELQAMQIGCHSIVKSADGILERHKITSRAYKNFNKPVVADWITIAEVGRAVAVIEKLTIQQRTLRKSPGLWQVLKMTTTTGTHIATTSTALVNAFRQHLDDAYGTAEAPAIPLVDGAPWHLTVRQFRRSIAWYIANRPFGTIAGKIQYKHASVAMFEGYAGDSSSGFRREIEQERAIGQLDDIVEHYEEFRRGLNPTGPASARLTAEFTRMQTELGDFPGRIVDHKRLRAMLAHLARTLYVGFLNDCFFEPATALCLERSRTEDRAQPVLTHCSPDKCPNSCIAHKHLPPWEASIAQADALLQDKRLSPNQRKALQSDNARKRALIAALKSEPP